MPVTEVRQALGSFTVSLRPTTPREILDALVYFGHLVILEGRLDPAQYGDELLSAARYVGVYRNRNNDVDNRTKNVDGVYQLRGVGMAHWLGDESGKGAIIETVRSFAGTTFANTVRALLPASVAEGTLHSVPGSYTGSHQWVTPRQALTYVCEMFGAEWRVNGDGSLDAGTVDQLYPPKNPAAMLVKHGYGRDMTLAAYQGKIDSAEDSEEFSTRVVVLAQGEGASIATGAANISSNPYRDLFGQPVQITRAVSESKTEPINANVRAQLELNEVSRTRRSLRLAANDYDVTGTLAVGDHVLVYDPDTGLMDPDSEAYFLGQRINPVRFRCSAMTWPIVDEMTIAYRGPDGTWVDLTPYVKWEQQGDVSVTIGDLPRVLSGGGVEPIGTRPSQDNSTPAAPEWDTPFLTSPYLDGLGNTRAQVVLAWNTPLNTDGSTVLDGLHYEIRFAPHPATEWQSTYAAWGTTSMLLQDLAPGLAYDIGIRAVDRYGNTSDWSVTEQITVAPDTIPPSTPAPPTVAASLIAVQITHTLGKASGGEWNLEPDLDHLEVHVGGSSGFTPDDTTLRGKVAANAGMMQAEIAAVGTVPESNTSLRHVKVIAVDRAGNRSSPSNSATVTALLIDDAHITNLSVTKVTAGTVSANWILGANIGTATSGQRVELNATGLHGYSAGGIETVSLLNTGSFTLRSNTIGARVQLDTGGLGLWDSSGVQTVALIAASGVFFMRSATSGARVDLSTISGLQLYNSSGVNTVALDPSGSFLLRSATSGARVHLDSSGLRLVNSGGVTTVDLNASGAFTLRSGSSGARVELDTNGLRGYNSSGQQTVDISASTGAATFVGQIATGFSGRRIVFNDGGTFPSIKFYPSSGTGTCVISAQDFTADYARLVHESPISSNRQTKTFLDYNGFQVEATRNVGGFPQTIASFAATGIALQWSGAIGASITLNDDGVRINGSNYKSFVIDHPTDPDRYLIHACTESPHPGVEYWGETTLDDNGQAVVQLPDYFEALTREGGRAVSVNTCSDELRNASATYPQDGRFVIHGAPGVRVTWIVKAIRADADGDSMLVEPRRDEVDVHGDGPYRYYTMRSSR